ncbi:hormone sensitive lipase like protein [Metarhizium robertsii]|uniref:Hormone sensitive lipase like protein n=1 Tax=Metarhizium robertsii TaxID=568076 RepID=A0A0A1UPJ2_9HYPO|nr:hormone sensitive lipase like protein [Metarhizium robertsii]
MASKLQGLKVLQTPYKTIAHHEIRTDVLVPETPLSGKRPVIVRFHGGGLVMGDSLYLPFYPQWLTDLALAHGAIIISPNYRLLPEATTPQIFQDVADFWAYIHSPSLASLLASQSPPVEADLARVLVTGDSAGGLLCLSTALTYPRDMRVAVATYPLVDPGAPEFTRPRENPPLGKSVPESVYDDALAAAEGGPAESSVTSAARLDFMLAATQHGRLGGLYARGLEDAAPAERRVYFPPEALEAESVRLPVGGVTILQGRDDSVVPVESVRRFVKRAREVVGDEVRLTETDGEHGFDVALRYDGWLKGELKRAVDAWLE